MSGTVHVVGAGIAGLAAAAELARAGTRVVLHEAAGAAGGRCRSFWDATLGARIDNGNHLVLSGNRAVGRYLAAVGASGALVEAPEAAFPFRDLATGQTWTLRVGPSVWRAWIGNRPRPPGLRLRDATDGFRLLWAGPQATVAEVIRGRGESWRHFWEPLTIAVMNAPPERAAARLLGNALAQSFARGGRACRPMFAPEGLGAALVEPALAFLEASGAALRFGHALRAVEARAGRATALVFDDGAAPLGPADRVVLALPPSRLAAVLPQLAPPRETGAILNAHFRLPPGSLASAPPLLGVLGAATQWIFCRGDIASVTISAAETSPLMAAPREAALATLWAEVRAALDLAGEPLAGRLLKEKRATFDQSPAGVAQRLPMRTEFRNLVLAGDHVRTGLPATLEGAALSGQRAARALLGAPRRRMLFAAAAGRPARA